MKAHDVQEAQDLIYLRGVLLNAGLITVKSANGQRERGLTDGSHQYDTVRRAFIDARDTMLRHVEARLTSLGVEL